MKPISSVQLGVARLGLICADTPDNAALGAWLRRFHRALALHDYSLDEYAAELLQDVEDYREAERNRKPKKNRIPEDSDGFQRKDEDSEHSQSVSQTDNQSNSKSEKRARSRFTPPTIEEVAAYCTERRNGIDPQHWIDSYAAKGWLVGKSPMRDWKAAVRTWEKNNFTSASKNGTPKKAIVDWGDE